MSYEQQHAAGGMSRSSTADGLSLILRPVAAGSLTSPSMHEQWMRSLTDSQPLAERHGVLLDLGQYILKLSVVRTQVVLLRPFFFPTCRRVRSNGRDILL